MQGRLQRLHELIAGGALHHRRSSRQWVGNSMPPRPERSQSNTEAKAFAVEMECSATMVKLIDRERSPCPRTPRQFLNDAAIDGTAAHRRIEAVFGQHNAIAKAEMVRTQDDHAIGRR
jgi:hypothetical protein